MCCLCYCVPLHFNEFKSHYFVLLHLILHYLFINNVIIISKYKSSTLNYVIKGHYHNGTCFESWYFYSQHLLRGSGQLYFANVKIL